jgi:acyl-CoA synthetase (AMP-forming)/AMP-acid ligase II
MNQRSTIFEVPSTAQGSAWREQVSIRYLLAAQAARIPDAIALAVLGRAPLTYHRLVEQIDYVTDALRGMGVERHGRVAVMLPPGPELAVASVAVAAAAACAPLNPSYPPQNMSTPYDTSRSAPSSYSPVCSRPRERLPSNRVYR